MLRKAFFVLSVVFITSCGTLQLGVERSPTPNVPAGNATSARSPDVVVTDALKSTAPSPMATSSQARPSTPNPACTSTPLPAEFKQTVYSSPNGEFSVVYLVREGNLHGNYINMDVVGCGRKYVLVVKGPWPPRFFGWSSDSRYAVFSYGNQYGHYWPIVFDMQQWDEIPIARPEGEPLCDMGPMHSCESRKIVGLLYSPDRVVYGDGSMVYLSNPYELVGAQAEGAIATAQATPALPTPLPPKPTGTPTPPTLSPTVLQCQFAWFFSSQPQQGCPRESPLQSNAAAQSFERGTMIWVKQLGRYFILSKATLFEGDVRKRLDYVHDPLDIIRDTSAEIVPPAGLYAPVSGFGLIWRGDVSQSPGYREVLGRALAPESGYDTLYQCDDAKPSGGYNWAFCYLRGSGGEVIVLYPQGGWYLLGER